MKRTFLNISLTILIGGFLTSCLDDAEPKVESTLDNLLGENGTVTYEQMAAKVYASLSLAGQDRDDSALSDIVSGDPGSNPFVRNLWNLQELPTDEAINRWGDGGLDAVNFMSVTAGNNFVTMTFDRLAYTIALSNSFIRETEGIEDSDIALYREEVRFIRALSYYYAIDLFGNFPFATEADPVGTWEPPMYTRKEIYNYIETELLDIQDKLAAPTTNNYGRIDQAAAWMLLSKLYLNATVYIGSDESANALIYSEKVLNSGYSLVDNYAYLFMADNNSNGAQNEVLFPLVADGVNSQSWGGSTYLVQSTWAGSDGNNQELAGIYGDGTAWEGNRSLSSLVDKFGDSTGTETITFTDNSSVTLDTWDDDRAMFFTDSHNYENTDYRTWADGYPVMKYVNLTSSGGQGQDRVHVDMDFPLIRLGEAYLIAAEAAIRSENNTGKALGYVNKLRLRAHADELTSITLNDILDERSRELYFEGHRRTDLIRYNKFAGSSYVWPWKGGTFEGTSIADYKNLYPFPETAINSNRNLVQNTGY